MQLLSPELLQLYIQQLLQQQAAQAAEDGEEEGDQRSVNIATGLIQQVSVCVRACVHVCVCVCMCVSQIKFHSDWFIIESLWYKPDIHLSPRVLWASILYCISGHCNICPSQLEA